MLQGEGSALCWRVSSLPLSIICCAEADAEGEGVEAALAAAVPQWPSSSRHVTQTDRQPQKKIKASVSFHIQPVEAFEWLRETSKLERSDFFNFR